MFPKRIFITGTGTDVGKTIVTCALAQGLARMGHDITYWKPIQAGLPADADMLARHGGSNLTIHPSEAAYTLPASPDQAAASENDPGVTVAQLQKAARAVPGEVHLIEGAGGVFVPLNDKAETWADFLAETGLPVLIAAHAGLGTLNHTALTVEALTRREIPILGVVLNGEAHQGNTESLQRMCPDLAQHAFPWLPELSAHPDWDAETRALAEFVHTLCRD